MEIPDIVRDLITVDKRGKYSKNRRAENLLLIKWSTLKVPVAPTVVM